jgi:hypothetical protein
MESFHLLLQTPWPLFALFPIGFFPFCYIVFVSAILNWGFLPEWKEQVKQGGKVSGVSLSAAPVSFFFKWTWISDDFSLYRHVPGVCVTNKTGSGFDDQIYWTFIQLVTTFHKSPSDTLSSSDWTLHGNYSDFQLNCQLLLASRYISSGQTTAQKAHPLPSSGCMRTHIGNISCNTGYIVARVYCGRCLEIGLMYCWLRICCSLVYRAVP